MGSLTIFEGCIWKDCSGDPDTIVVSSANCFCTWGKGFALRAKKEQPQLFLLDKTSIKGDYNKLGTCLYEAETNGIIGAIVYGQYGYSNTKKVFEVDMFCKGLRSLIDNFPLHTYAMPLVGCNNAGEVPENTLPHIAEVAKEMDVDIHIYVLGSADALKQFEFKV